MKANQIEGFLNLKNQESRIFEPKLSFAGKDQCLQVLQMLKKKSLMIAKVFFNIEPFLCHFQVKSNLFEKLIATNWWLKLVLEIFLGCMSMFTKPKVADIPNLGVFQDYISMTEVHVNDFLNTKVANQILQIQDVGFDDSMIHVSYCLDQIL